MLSLLKKQPSHEEVFMERYSSILTWAKTLTKGDPELTEDIVQDAYIQFTLNAPPLSEIQNLDGYLYILLKNLCLANIRRSGRNRLTQLSIFEYDSAEFAFSRIDYRDQETARDELQKICSFLTVRKNKARTAGVFILRFFHGYFPSEIARVLRTSRPAVDVRLLEARKEIKAFLENPKDVKFIGFDDSAKEIFRWLPVQVNSNHDEFLHRLRTVIFNVCEGEHQSTKELNEFYGIEKMSPIKIEKLSHLVSCPRCLDAVNLKLKLPNLSSRFPTDAIGRDKKKDRDSDNDNDSGGTKGENMFGELDRKVRQVFEHKPKELRVAVNGKFQGTLKVNSDLNEFDLAFADKEPIEFIEIYSEQQLRLLFLNFDNSIPHHKAASTYNLNLSDERFLRVNIDFAAQGAEIKLSYRDPTYKQVQAILENPGAIDEIVFPASEIKPKKSATYSTGNNFADYFSNLNKLFSFGWRQASFAVLTLVIAFGGWFFLENQSRLSAKEVLEEAEKKQLNWQYQPDKILYWEEVEKQQNSSEPVFTKRWSNNLNGRHEILILKYDERNELFWGKWVKGDGTMIIFNGQETATIIYPSISQIKEKLDSLGETEQKVLRIHLVSLEKGRDAEQQSQLHTNLVLKHISNQSVTTAVGEDNRNKLFIFVKSEISDQDPIVQSTELEVQYDAENFQRTLYRMKFFRKDGTSSMYEARLLKIGEATLEQFQNNELAQILAQEKNIKYFSVEELAEKLKTIYLPAKK